MKFVEAGTADGRVRVSAIGVGCWQFGSADWGYGKSYGETTAGEIVTTALDLGINLFDTAEAYARGASEAILGRALQGRRDDAFIATKFTPAMPTASRVAEHGRQSAHRLGVSVIDLYQIHWPNPVFSLKPQFDGMRMLLDEGIIRNVGVSNYGADRWAAADDALGRPVLSNQVHFSLLSRKPDQANVPYAQQNERIVIAYSPLEMGVLGGKYSASNPPPGTARRRSPLCLPENLERAEPVLEAVRRVAAAHDATPAQVALAWLIRKPNVAVIPGASSVDQLRHNAAAGDLDLTDAEADELTAASDAFTPLSHVDTAKGLWRNRNAR